MQKRCRSVKFTQYHSCANAMLPSLSWKRKKIFWQVSVPNTRSIPWKNNLAIFKFKDYDNNIFSTKYCCCFGNIDLRVDVQFSDKKLDSLGNLTCKETIWTSVKFQVRKVDYVYIEYGRFIRNLVLYKKLKQLIF